MIFLKEPLTAKVAMKSVPTRPGVDEAHAGTGVLYFSRLIREGHPEPAQQDRLVADLPERDDPELEHHDEAAADDGRGIVRDAHRQLVVVPSRITSVSTSTRYTSTRWW